STDGPLKTRDYLTASKSVIYLGRPRSDIILRLVRTSFSVTGRSWSKPAARAVTCLMPGRVRWVFCCAQTPASTDRIVCGRTDLVPLSEPQYQSRRDAKGAGDGKSLVLGATDIVELIGQTVSLKRRGKDYVGLCPFHQEKTPSFHVSPARQFFHCFGCKASGNSIDFVMQRDRVEFVDALRTLGQAAGIEMPRFGGYSKGK